MPTITFAFTDEDVERIASQVAIKLAGVPKEVQKQHPVQPQLQHPVPINRLQVSRTEAARLLGYKNAVTVDSLRKRGLLHPNLATRRPMYSIKELERFVREYSQPV